MLTSAQALGITTAEIVAYSVLAILLVVIAVSVRIVVECVRKHYANPVLMGALLFGSSIGSLLFMALSSARVIPRFKAGDWVPIIGIVVWFASLVFYAVVASAKKRREEGHDDRVADWQRDLDAGAVSPYDIEQTPDAAPVAAAPPAAPEVPAGPRRAVSLPANESDGSARASEQTLKRVSAAKLAAADKPQGPRADEVASNPILADGEVRIRCLACDKKMKADAAKFRKQRRCPSCKAEPFRYITAI